MIDMRLRVYFFSIFIVFIAGKLCAQTCSHNDLSNNFRFETSIKRVQRTNDSDSCIIGIAIINKKTNKVLQSIQLRSIFLIDKEAFINCNNNRSYLTGVNRDVRVEDWDYGDIVLADFNFDDREDFAIKREIGGNGGPLYNYYIQTSDSCFVLDNFLTNTLDCFPTYFDRKQKRITTVCRGTSVSNIVSVYQYDSCKNKWAIFNRKTVEYNKK